MTKVYNKITVAILLKTVLFKNAKVSSKIQSKSALLNWSVFLCLS